MNIHSKIDSSAVKKNGMAVFPDKDVKSRAKIGRFAWEEGESGAISENEEVIATLVSPCIRTNKVR